MRPPSWQADLAIEEMDCAILFSLVDLIQEVVVLPCRHCHEPACIVALLPVLETQFLRTDGLCNGIFFPQPPLSDEGAMS